MSVIDQQIEQMRQRLRELEPLLEEADLLKRSIASLERERASSGELGAQRPKSERYDEFRRYQEHVSLRLRKKQIREIMEEHPGITNREIAERLGITGARVGQIRKEMRDDE